MSAGYTEWVNTAAPREGVLARISIPAHLLQKVENVDTVTASQYALEGNFVLQAPNRLQLLAQSRVRWVWLDTDVTHTWIPRGGAVCWDPTQREQAGSFGSALARASMIKQAGKRHTQSTTANLEMVPVGKIKQVVYGPSSQYWAPKPELSLRAFELRTRWHTHRFVTHTIAECHLWMIAVALAIDRAESGAAAATQEEGEAEGDTSGTATFRSRLRDRLRLGKQTPGRRGSQMGRRDSVTTARFTDVLWLLKELRVTSDVRYAASVFRTLDTERSGQIEGHQFNVMLARLLGVRVIKEIFGISGSYNLCPKDVAMQGLMDQQLETAGRARLLIDDVFKSSPSFSVGPSLTVQGLAALFRHPENTILDLDQVREAEQQASSPDSTMGLLLLSDFWVKTCFDPFAAAESSQTMPRLLADCFASGYRAIRITVGARDAFAPEAMVKGGRAANGGGAEMTIARFCSTLRSSAFISSQTPVILFLAIEPFALPDYYEQIATQFSSELTGLLLNTHGKIPLLHECAGHVLVGALPTTNHTPMDSTLDELLLPPQRSPTAEVQPQVLKNLGGLVSWFFGEADNAVEVSGLDFIKTRVNLRGPSPQHPRGSAVEIVPPGVLTFVGAPTLPEFAHYFFLGRCQFVANDLTDPSYAAAAIFPYVNIPKTNALDQQHQAPALAPPPPKTSAAAEPSLVGGGPPPLEEAVAASAIPLATRLGEAPASSSFMGYVRIPDFTAPTPCDMTLEILYGHMMPTPFAGLETTFDPDFLCPHIQFRTTDETVQTAKTHMCPNEGLVLRLAQACTFHLADERKACLHFEVMHSSDSGTVLLAWNAFRVCWLRLGVRWVPLLDPLGRELPWCGLWVKITKTIMGGAEHKPRRNKIGKRTPPRNLSPRNP